MLSCLKFKLFEKDDDQAEQNQLELKIRCGHSRNDFSFVISWKYI